MLILPGSKLFEETLSLALIPPTFQEEMHSTNGESYLIFREGDNFPTTVNKRQLEEYLYGGEYELVSEVDNLAE